jgi:hypothetical protein
LFRDESVILPFFIDELNVPGCDRVINARSILIRLASKRSTNGEASFVVSTTQMRRQDLFSWGSRPATAFECKN